MITALTDVHLQWLHIPNIHDPDARGLAIYSEGHLLEDLEGQVSPHLVLRE